MSLEQHGSEEVPEELTARGNLIASGGEVDFDYAVGALSVEATSTSIALIAVAEVERELLVAVPAEAWNKKIAKRVLPPGALRKAVRVVVPICAEGDRTAAAGEPSLAVWLGLLNVGLEPMVSYELAAEMAFPDLPFAEALAAVANDHFSFVTAESEVAATGMEARFAALEQQMQEMMGLLRQSSGGRGKDPTTAARAKPPDLPPGLDPGVAQQALQAGVSRQALEEMAAVLSAPRPSALRQPTVVDVPHVTFEEEDDFADPADAEGSGAADPVSTAVLQMSKILAQMHQEKHKARDKSLEGILDYAESGSAPSTTSAASRSKAAALRSLQRMLTEKPQLIYGEIEKAMQQDWERSGQLPGVASGGVTARG